MAEDRVGPVAVVDVVVDDRDALEPELAPRHTRGDGDAVEEAETHRLVAQRVMSRRAHEREAAAQRRLDRSAGGERCGFEGRLRRDGVGGQPRMTADRADVREVFGAVAEQQLVLGRGAALAPVREVLEQDPEPLFRFGMRARRVQMRERGVGQDVDRTISSSSSSDAPPARARPSEVTEQRSVRPRAARAGREPGELEQPLDVLVAQLEGGAVDTASLSQARRRARRASRSRDGR